MTRILLGLCIGVPLLGTFLLVGLTLAALRGKK